MSAVSKNIAQRFYSHCVRSNTFRHANRAHVAGPVKFTRSPFVPTGRIAGCLKVHQQRLFNSSKHDDSADYVAPAAKSSEPIVLSETEKLKAPLELTEMMIEVLEHWCDELPGDPPALSYDPDGSLKRKLNQFMEKITLKDLDKFFSGNPHLNLEKRGFDDFEILLICRMAKFCGGGDRKFVNLNYNNSGDAGCAPIADYLVKQSHLRSLFLTSNNITDKGIERLSGALLFNRNLEILELRKNQITDEGVGFLLAALQGHASLKTLFLSDNLISDSGAVRLVTRLPEDCKIWLQNSPNISEKTRTALVETCGKVKVKF